MPGFLLLDDAQKTLGDSLNDFGQNLLQQGQQAVQDVQQSAADRLNDFGQGVLQLGQQQAPPQVSDQAPAPAPPASDQSPPADTTADLTPAPAPVVPPPLSQPPSDTDNAVQRLTQHGLQVLGQGVINLGQDAQQAAQQAGSGVINLAAPPSASSPAASSTTAPDLSQPPSSGTSGGAPPTGAIDASSPAAFARSVAPYAQYAAQQLGIDPTWVTAMMASESNYGKAPGNELFGVKALPGQKSQTLLTHEGEYGGQQMNQSFAAYDTPLDSVNAWVDLIKNHYQRAVGAQTLGDFVHGLKQGGYFTAAEPEYLGILQGIGDRVGGDVQGALQGAQNTASTVASAVGQTASTVGSAVSSTLGNVSQFGDKQLSAAEAYAACGPAAAVRFAQLYGRNPTLREATDLAAQVGWTQSGGMAGLSSESKLFDAMGIPHRQVGADWQALAREAQSGNPVVISTPGHYFTADAYDPTTGAFHVGASGTDLRGGSEWMTPDQMQQRMGQLQGGLVTDHPNVPAQSPLSAGAQVVQDVAQPVLNVVSGATTAAGSAAKRGLQVLDDAVSSAKQDVIQLGQSGLQVLGDTSGPTPASAQPLPSDALTNPIGTRYTAPTTPPSSDTSVAPQSAISGPPGGPPTNPLDQVKQKFNDALDSLGSLIQSPQAQTVGQQALDLAGQAPLPLTGGRVSDLASAARGSQAALDVIEQQRQQYQNRPNDFQQFQSNVDAARRGDWGAFVQGTFDLANRAVEPLTGGPQADISQAVSAGLTAAGVDPNSARVLGQVANVVGPLALERAIPSVVGAAQRGTGAAVNAGLEAIDRLAPPEVAYASSRRAGESAEDYLARLAGQAPEAASTGTQILGPRGEVVSTVHPEAPPELGFHAPETTPAPPAEPGFRAPVTGEPAVTDVGSPQLVSPTGEVLSRVTGQPVAAAGEELAGNIRLPKFVQQPVRDIIEQVHAADPQRFDAARRGVVTNEMLQDLADQAGTTVNRVAAAWKPGKAANAETILAMRQALADRALRVRAAQNLLRQNPTSIDARNTMLQAMNQHAALQEAVAGVTAEAGRAVAQFRQPVTGEEAALSALQRIAKNTGLTPAELTDHLANVDLSDPASVANLARTLTTHTFADKAQALWYFALLSNPVTQLRNLIGNTMVLGTRPLESLAAAGIDAARADLTGTARQRFFGESPAEIIGGLAASGDALKAAFRTLRTGLTPQDLANPEFAGRTEPFQGRLADLTVNAPGRMLAATDTLFRTLNQGASVYQQAYRQAASEGTRMADMPARVAEIVRNPTQELLDRAGADAAYRVFQNANTFATGVGKAREAMPFGSGRFVLPFINTPVNVGAYALERSPLGVLKLAGSAAERSGGQLSDNIARATLGTGLAGYIAYQAAQGNVTGAAPTDPTERDAWQREGKQPYSVKLGDTWYSYAPLQPFSSIIAAGAAAGDAWQKGQNDPTSGLNPASLIALTGVAAGRAMLDQPWLQGLAGVADAFTSGNDPQTQGDPLKSISLNAQRALASAVVPAGVRQLARMFDPTVRTSDPGWEGFGQQIASGIPGLSQNAPPRLNAFGEPSQRPTSGLAALNPFNPSQETNDPVEKELRRLQDGGYDVEPSLVSNRVTLLSEALKLTPDQQRQYQGLAGTMTHDLLESLLQTDAYRNLRPDQQATVINRLSDRVADAARKTLYPSLLDQAVEQKIAQTAKRQQTQPPDWLIRQATGSAEAPTGEAPMGSANRTVAAVP